MRILITGGGGFIGTATGRKLVEQGHDCAVLDMWQARVHPDRAAIVKQTREWADEIYYGDVRDRWLVARAIDGFEPDAILHLAAYQDFQQDYHTFIDTNVSATASMYELLRDRNWHGSVVIAGSQAVIGDGAYNCNRCYTATDTQKHRYYGLHREQQDIFAGRYEMYCPYCDTAMEPTWTREGETAPAQAYGISKMGEEQIGLTLGRIHDIRTVVPRYSIVQGAGQSPHNTYSGVLRAMAMQLLAGRDEVVVFEDGLQQRDYVTIADVVNFNVMALTGIVPSGAYHVGGNRVYTVNRLGEILCKIAGRGKLVRPGLVRIGDVRHALSHVGRAADCGWHPTGVLEENVTSYWEWLVKQNVDPQQSVRALDVMMETGSLVQTR